MDIISTILKKIKIDELFAIMFILCLFTTLIPKSLAKTIQIYDFRKNNQFYITVILLITGAYYVYLIFKQILKLVVLKLFSNKRIAIKYMKKHLTYDQMQLIIFTFYDKEHNQFKSCGYINIVDGRIAALQKNKIIYRSSNIENIMIGFAFNLQTYALEFLNENLKKGNIEIFDDKFIWDFNK